MRLVISHLHTTHLPGSTFHHCQSDPLLGLLHEEDAVTCNKYITYHTDEQSDCISCLATCCIYKVN
jgi:hypothetical protein